MSLASLQGATRCQVPPPRFLPCTGWIAIPWVQPQPSTAFLRVSPQGPSPPSFCSEWLHIYIYTHLHLSRSATLSTRFQVCGQGKSKEEIRPRILAGTQPKLEVGDTKIIGGKSCETIKINF